MLNKKNEKRLNKYCLLGRIARRREIVPSNRTWQHNLGFAKLHLNKLEDFQHNSLWADTIKVEIGQETHQNEMQTKNKFKHKNFKQAIKHKSVRVMIVDCFKATKKKK